MKMLDSGKDKIQKICDLLRHETLEPAKEEAEGIIENAKKEAHEIILEAHRRADDLIVAAKASIAKERDVFQSALKEASKQSIEAMKQDIEHKLFSETLYEKISQEMVNPKIIEMLITSMVEAVKKEGISADFSAIIPRDVSVEAINALLKQEVLSMLKEKSVVVGTGLGGAELQLHDKKMKVVISNQDVTEIVAKHLRKEFRQWLFQ